MAGVLREARTVVETEERLIADCGLKITDSPTHPPGYQMPDTRYQIRRPPHDLIADYGLKIADSPTHPLLIAGCGLRVARF